MLCAAPTLWPNAVQVHIQDASSQVSSSQRHEVMLRVVDGRSLPQDPAEPLPLEVSWPEWFVLWNNWPRFLQL